jgi:hypothetical protein
MAIKLQGYLTNDNGTPDAGADVEIFDAPIADLTSPGVVRASTTTDADGFWTISHATQGKFSVRITSGSSIRWVMYEDSRQMEELEVGVLKIRDSTDDSHTLSLTTGNITADTTLDLSSVGSISRIFQLQLFAPTTPVSTGDGKAYLIIPSDLNGFNLTAVHVRHITAGTTNVTTYQVHNVTQAADMLTTKLTVDSTETGSNTAATPAVIDAANDDVASWDLLRIDCDTVSTTAPQGCIVTLVFEAP